MEEGLGCRNPKGTCDHNIEQLHAIVIAEGDHQLNGKQLKKTLVDAKDDPYDEKNADEQCGCHKLHRAIEVVANA